MDKEVLARFFKGECDEHEVKLVMDWLHSEKADDFFSDELLDVWAEYEQNKKHTVYNEFISQKIIETLFDKKKNVQPVYEYRHSRRKLSFWPLRIAGSLFIVFAAVALYFFNGGQDKIPEEFAMVVKENPKGQKSRIYLPDGSVIWLNSESQIKYPEKFGDSIRQVSLRGEAYFEVVKNTDLPFIVKAGHTSTIVLGTSFNINAYPENEGVTVSLVTGKVHFKLQSSSFEESKILAPGEGAHASFTKSSLNSFRFDPKKNLGWKDGLLVFEKANLALVISELERWYGVDIKTEGQTHSSWSFSGTFDNENLSNVLMNLSKMRDFSYEISGKEVIVKFN